MLFDSPSTLEPAEILSWLALCSAGLDCEERDAYLAFREQRDVQPALVEALGIGASREEISQYFASCRQELGLAAVLALTAAAEARIRLDAVLRIEKNKEDLASRLRVLRSNARTEWAIPLYEDGILDEWKRYIGSLTDVLGADRARLLTTIGRFKTLLLVRHWVAHGRYWVLKWGVEHHSPADAAEIVIELFDALRRAADHRSLMSFA